VPRDEADVGSILARHARPVTPEQRRAVSDLSACRTKKMGGRVFECSACGKRQHLYNSCGNRHCPVCQGRERALWLEREASHLLPVEYHHLVFTLPKAAAGLARRNPRLIYGLLFAAASACVLELAADPKHLGAQPGLTAVLHTWGQTLTLHPHLHVMATGGGLSCDRKGRVDEQPCWKSCRRGFFLPVRALSRLFRGKFIDGLRQVHQRGELRPGRERQGPGAFDELVRELYRQEWVVYSKPPTAGPEVVLKYLARYTYRVAISNKRLVQVTDDSVTFEHKDYRQGGKRREMTLGGEEFARRFLQHVLPKGFVRVRHYGLLANRSRQEKLKQCRKLLLAEPARQRLQAGATGEESAPGLCPCCGEGEMRLVEVLSRQREEVNEEVAREDGS
jgi:hypothetical protein